MKWFKRLLLTLAIVAVLVILLTALGYRRLHGVPDWYTVRTFSAEQLQKLEQAAENKFINAQNWAAEHRAIESANRKQGTTQSSTEPTAATKPADTTTIELTEEEVNALFQKWLARSGYVDKLKKYLVDPVLVIRDGRVIVAGTLAEMNTLASVHFEPKVTAEGNLDLRLVKVLGGKLPLPKAVWSSQREKIIQAVAKHMPGWARAASIDDSGIANTDAINVALTRMLVHVLNDEPSEPVIFLPVIQRGAVPARLTDVAVEDETLSLTVTPMTPAEREAFLAKLKGTAPKVIAAR